MTGARPRVARGTDGMTNGTVSNERRRGEEHGASRDGSGLAAPAATASGAAGRERMDLGFEAESDATAARHPAPALDLSGFKPKRRERVPAPELTEAHRVAEATGFRSREPGPPRGRRGTATDPAGGHAPPAGDTTAERIARDIEPGRMTPQPAEPPSGHGTRAPSPREWAGGAAYGYDEPRDGVARTQADPDTAHVRPPRRRRTGRNVQFNIKARADTIEAFTEIADLMDWGFGETLEHAVDLLQREYGSRKAES